MENGFIAHVRKSDKQTQSVSVHLCETAALAAFFAAKLGLALAGELIGLFHDFGKYSLAFYDYIRGATQLLDPDLDNDNLTPNGKHIDHSTAGAQWVYQRLSQFGKNGNGQLCGQILGLCIASHHGSGLIDCLDLEGNANWQKRFSKSDELSHLSECIKNVDPQIMQRAESLADKELLAQMLPPLKAALTLPISNKIKEFYLGCFTRFLFSCLIDADRISSADFDRMEQANIRRLQQQPNWSDAIQKLEHKLSQFKAKYPIDTIRQQISNTCLKRAHDPQGIYTLTVPTGGGKTLSSLRYALNHAQHHNLDRIIYIIPYTSIIDQNADEVRKILGDEWVLEHHSNLDPEKQSWENKLLAENWDKPIVFTTMVQFLDAWFGSGTRGARHIHPMTRSVLIFDEIQTLPIKCVHLFCNTLNWLTLFGKSSAILCTATQPLLGESELTHFPETEQTYIKDLGLLNLANNAEIIGNSYEINQLFNSLSRVQIQFKQKTGGWSVDDAGVFLLKKFRQFSSCLFVVNTKKWAQELYQYCKQQNIPQEALFHLSTNQCAAHRKFLFDQIKNRLKNKQPVLCISTQLIEAGVDISMACVIRALAGLDSIAQAAGRCNRHGENKGKGQVWVLNLQEQNLSLVLPDINIGQQHAERIFREYAGKDVLQPSAMQQYFQYYFYNRFNEMDYKVKNDASNNLLDWLSDNCRNTYSEKNDKRRQAKQYPLLMQSFKSAGKAFSVIDAPTHAVIVPYAEGKECITTLCSQCDADKKTTEFYNSLRKAQRFSVNVFPNIWHKLQSNNALIEIGKTGIYYLRQSHYDNEFGLSLEGGALMDTYSY